METKSNIEMWRCADTEADALAVLRELMDLYGNDVWNYAFALLRRTASADYIAQEVFIRVYRNLPEFNGDAAPKIKLLSLTRNCVADYKRSTFFRQFFFARTPAASIEQHLEDGDSFDHKTANELWRQILSLPVKMREALILSSHYQLSTAEIADILGASEGTVKARLRNARRRILEQREGMPDGPKQQR